MGTEPTCKLLGPSSIIQEANFAFQDKGALCSDSVDGFVQTIVKGSVYIYNTGTYELQYTARDKSGNVAKTLTRKVVIQDTLKPVIALSYKGKDIHIGDASDSALLHDGTVAANPAASHFKNAMK